MRERGGAERAERSGAGRVFSGVDRAEWIRRLRLFKSRVGWSEWSEGGVEWAEWSGAESAEWSGSWRLCMIRVGWTERSGGDV